MQGLIHDLELLRHLCAKLDLRFWDIIYDFCLPLGWNRRLWEVFNLWYNATCGNKFSMLSIFLNHVWIDWECLYPKALARVKHFLFGRNLVEWKMFALVDTWYMSNWGMNFLRLCWMEELRLNYIILYFGIDPYNFYYVP